MRRNYLFLSEDIKHAQVSNKTINDYSSLVIILLLLFSTIFFSLDSFIDAKVVPKWYGFIIISFIGAIVILFCKTQSLKLDFLSILVSLFIFILLIRGYVSGMPIVDISIFISFFLLFIFFKTCSLNPNIVDFLIIIISVIQAFYALLQFVNILPTHNTFRVIGSYGNPGGVAVNMAIVFPLIFSFIKKNKIISVISIVIILTTVVITQSRAGLVSITTVSAIYFYYHFPNRFFIYKKQILSILSIVALTLFIYLFFLKENSAVGRTLVWKVTGNLISDNFIFGGGNYIFPAQYMKYQADYFVQNKESNYSLLADNMLHPFNEYFLYIARYGVIAFALLVIVIVCFLRSNKIYTPHLLCLISLAVFALFSYPLQYPISWVIAAYSLALLSNDSKPLFFLSYKSTSIRILVILSLYIGAFFLIKEIKFEYEWNKVAKLSLSGKTKDVLPRYDQLYKSWNGNYLFLYNYAAELNQIGYYNKSLEVLNFCVSYSDDYDIEILLGNNFFNLGKWEISEKHFQIASNMCPNRFVPLYMLHEISLKETNKKKALHFARKIVKKKIKINSSIVYYIRNQMKKYTDSVDKSVSRNADR